MGEDTAHVSHRTQRNQAGTDLEAASFYSAGRCYAGRVTINTAQL